LGSSEIMINNNIAWISLIVIILFVGGLIIVYIFILSINSNEIVNRKIIISFIIPTLIIYFINMRNQIEEKSMLGSSIFSNGWDILLLIIISIIISIIFISKIIFNPSNPSKRIK
jgi:ABC-type transport system involved in multi-copper enzyme maturation permease subunit